jgi:hypothetical protein
MEFAKKVGANIFSGPATVDHENSGGLTKSSFCGKPQTHSLSSKYVVWEAVFMNLPQKEIQVGLVCALRDLEWTFFKPKSTKFMILLVCEIC